MNHTSIKDIDLEGEDRKYYLDTFEKVKSLGSDAVCFDTEDSFDYRTSDHERVVTYIESKYKKTVLHEIKGPHEYFESSIFEGEIVTVISQDNGLVAEIWFKNLELAESILKELNIK